MPHHVNDVGTPTATGAGAPADQGAVGGALVRARSAVDSFDAGADRLLDHLRGQPAADRLFYGASALGESGLIWILLAALRGLRTGDRDRRAAVRVAAAVAVESVIINVGIKSVFRRQRPQAGSTPRPYHVRKPLTSSFPSAHGASSFCAATLLADGDASRAPLYYATAVVVATSRVYVRVHRASDVVAGAALGLTCGRLVRRVVPLDH
jgi:undecaprenyl-diphosphatase